MVISDRGWRMSDRDPSRWCARKHNGTGAGKRAGGARCRPIAVPAR